MPRPKKKSGKIEISSIFLFFKYFKETRGQSWFPQIFSLKIKEDCDLLKLPWLEAKMEKIEIVHCLISLGKIAYSRSSWFRQNIRVLQNPIPIFNQGRGVPPWFISSMADSELLSPHLAPCSHLCHSEKTFWVT